MPYPSVFLLAHIHFDQRDRPVQECLQVGRHAVAVQRETPDHKVCGPVFIQDSVLVIIDHTVAIHFLPAAEAAPAGGNLFVDHVDDLHFMLLVFIQSLQEGLRHPEGIAFLLGAPVQYNYFH